MKDTRMNIDQDLEMGTKAPVQPNFGSNPVLPAARRRWDGPHSLPGYTSLTSPEAKDADSSIHEENEKIIQTAKNTNEDVDSRQGHSHPDELRYQRTLNYIMQQEPEAGIKYAPESTASVLSAHSSDHSTGPVNDIPPRGIGYGYPYGTFVNSSPPTQLGLPSHPTGPPQMHQTSSQPYQAAHHESRWGKGAVQTANQGICINGCTYYDRSQYPAYLPQDPYTGNLVGHVGNHPDPWSWPSSHDSYPQQPVYNPTQRAQRAHRELQRGLHTQKRYNGRKEGPAFGHGAHRSLDFQMQQAGRNLHGQPPLTPYQQQRLPRSKKPWKLKPRLTIRNRGL